jgi:asparagine synthase (glutamine-hydrolysing)
MLVILVCEDMKVTVAVLDKQCGNAVADVTAVLGTFSFNKSSHFELLTPTKIFSNRDLESLNSQGANSSTTVGYASSQSKAASGYSFLQLGNATLVFEGRIYHTIPKTDVMNQLRKEPEHCETILQKLLEKADGDYSFLLFKDDWIVAGRDPIGVQPLFYGENKNVIAVATNRKALWNLGIEKPLSFPPGNMAFANREGFQFKPIKRLIYKEPKPITTDDAAEKLQVIFERSIQRRIHGLNEIAVAFSGGLDSSLVAFFARNFGAKVKLLHVSMENQPEIEEAMAVSAELNLPLQVFLFKDSDVEKALPRVIELIEEPDPIKASIGLSFYWTAEKAAESGFKMLLAGQGADELFGGYQRYVSEYCKEGSEKVRKTMFNDVVGIHESNLERDLKICVFHDVELRLPFASLEVAEFALSLPIECKIEKKTDTLRKLVLRKLASNAGIPSSVVNKPKKAVQYSTGISDALKRISKKHCKTVSEYIASLFQESRY